jgi:hypothetical protein
MTQYAVRKDRMNRPDCQSLPGTQQGPVMAQYGQTKIVDHDLRKNEYLCNSLDQYKLLQIATQ